MIEQLLFRLKIRDPEIFRNIRPEESQGVVSAAELQAARENTQAALQGKPPPSPPQSGQDHRTRLEVYLQVGQLLQVLQQESQILNELIQLQRQLLEQEESKQTKVPKAGRNGAPQSIQSIGSLQR